MASQLVDCLNEQLLLKLRFNGVKIHYCVNTNTGDVAKLHDCPDSNSWIRLYTTYVSEHQYQKDFFPTCQQMITLLRKHHINMRFIKIVDLQDNELWSAES